MKQFFGKKSRSALALVIMISFALHVVAILIFGTIKFVSDVLREETVFEAAPVTPPPQKEPEYQVNLQQRNQSTPPPRPPAIVVNNPAELNIPALDIDVNVDSSSVYGRGGGGFGGGLSGVREMAIGDLKLTDFGYTGRAPGTLEGTLIDMKRAPSGQPTNLTNKSSRKEAIREFTDGTWKLSRLTKKFFAAEDKRYSSYWMIKRGSAARAPEAFGVDGVIEPTGIAAYYEGSFTPEEDMDMRFEMPYRPVNLMNRRHILYASGLTLATSTLSLVANDSSSTPLPPLPRFLRLRGTMNWSSVTSSMRRAHLRALLKTYFRESSASRTAVLCGARRPALPVSRSALN